MQKRVEKVRERIGCGLITLEKEKIRQLSTLTAIGVGSGKTKILLSKSPRRSLERAKSQGRVVPGKTNHVVT